MKIENLDYAMDEMFDFITDLPSGLDGFVSNFDAAFRELEKVKSADVAPVVHGEWIDYLSVSGDGNLQSRCSQCELTNDAKTNFCPNCGADMRGDNHD